MSAYEREARALALELALKRVPEAAAMLKAGRAGLAVKTLRAHLKAHPRDAGARFHLVAALIHAGRPEPALGEADALVALAPGNPVFRAQKAAALEAVEDYEGAAELWRGIVDADDDVPAECWLRYGHALRGLGRGDDAIAAYRRAIATDPGFGRAWWSLADLKTLRFSDDDVAAMERALDGAAQVDRVAIHFALGKALGDAARYAESFAHYAKANALHRMSVSHDPAVLGRYVARCRAAFTPALMRDRRDAGCASPDPIFIVGMARAGSTLLEQMLASHSAIEGTKELGDLALVARELQAALGPDYPSGIETVAPAELERLGARYVESTRPHRKTDRPRFLDKMGANFTHVGLIALILPNAKIVDMRRHPMACGFSNFVQHFAQGQHNAYRLSDIGQLTRDYVALMAHFDRAMPGRVHRVLYERLVADPEAELRRLLDYLELPFEAQCLDFHKTARVVTTASSEQVRRPIAKDAIPQWRHYEPWLEPLKAALGPVLEAYPGVPDLG
ncbi:MAG: sulfotransferase [Alphaproteobacteria bacterium]|nr:sulfotransferase [Alphaproteobacteria bacterium]